MLIDHPEGTYDAALGFWAGASGGTAAPQPGAPYASLGRVGGLGLEVQRIGAATPARLHLDIETDDVPSEVARLVGLGASVDEERNGYTIMRDPGGLVFCVVPVQTGEAFAEHAVTWP